MFLNLLSVEKHYSISSNWLSLFIQLCSLRLFLIRYLFSPIFLERYFLHRVLRYSRVLNLSTSIFSGILRSSLGAKHSLLPLIFHIVEFLVFAMIVCIRIVVGLFGYFTRTIHVIRDFLEKIVIQNIRWQKWLTLWKNSYTRVLLIYSYTSVARPCVY